PPQHIAQKERGALLRRQELDQGEERQLDRLLRQNERIRSEQRVRDWLKPGHFGKGFWIAARIVVRYPGELRPSSVGRDHIETCVRCDAIQPRAKRSISFEALSVLPRAGERLLHGIFGIVERAQHAIAVDQQLAPVLFCEGVEGGLVSRPNGRSGCRGL